MLANLKVVSNEYTENVRTNIVSCFNIQVSHQAKQEHTIAFKRLKAKSTYSDIERTCKQIYFIVYHKQVSKHSNSRSGKRISSNINEEMLSVYLY